MSTVKRVLMITLVGALLGAVVGTLVARSFIPRYWTPGDVAQGTQQLCNMPVLVRGTIDKVVQDQLVGAAIGAILFAIGGGLVMRALAKRHPDAPAPA